MKIRLKKMVPLLKHTSELLFVTPGKRRGRFPANPVTSEGKRCRWHDLHNTRGGHGALRSLPRALPTLRGSRGIWGTKALEANSGQSGELMITGP